ncbi:MAG: hypothetical protein K2K42_02715 [Eubacterium sp.]|nr:hypothetical protein [Eubacterium sp.]
MNKLPKRKRLRLIGYDYSKDGAYFITICTKDKRCVLSSIVGCDDHIAPKVQLTKIGAIVNKYLLQINGLDSYVIMPNHIHLIIVKENEQSGTMWSSCPTNISSNIRTFKTLITKEIGVSIWQSKFYDHIIRDEYDYMVHVQYIEENPAKWVEDKYYL